MISKCSTNEAASPVQGNLRFQIGNETGNITQLKQLFTMHEASSSIPSMQKINRKNLSYTDGKMEALRIKVSLQGYWNTSQASDSRVCGPGVCLPLHSPLPSGLLQYLLSPVP